MSLRRSGPGFADAIHRRLDEVLESEDAVMAPGRSAAGADRGVPSVW